MNAETHLRHLRAAVGRIDAVLAGHRLDTPVPSCPGWDLADLARHLIAVQRWVTGVLAAGAPPSAPPSSPDDVEDLVAQFRHDAQALVDALAAADPAGPTWHPFGGPMETWVWHRRQAHEHTIHGWDAERAVGETTPLDAELASDGIDEYLSVGLPRVLGRDGVEAPSGSLHLHCTDVDGEWLVWFDDGLQLRREHAKGDAAVRGPAEAMLLTLWGRSTPRRSELDVVGDASVAEAWLSTPSP